MLIGVITIQVGFQTSFE